MYRALYRKWRPLRFQDVVGQTAIVTALCNQIASQHIGHAYLFTGVRGTGKTSCAKIFAKAINCMHPVSGDPCGKCEACLGIENGSILDVVEMDAASNNGVDNIRDLRDETAYTPSTCQYKVYIIDEVHMLSTQAFNALLKTLEEPPPHVVFILATTEIQKVPATILSRCQRYDFTRIQPSDLAARALFVAKEEGISLTDGAADLIARLADGALRDTLSILDTCAGVTHEIDEEVVRRMAGVTNKSYLFHLSQYIAQGDSVSALSELAVLRQKSVDLKRLAEELILHYRNLMLATLPSGNTLLSNVSPEEEAQYLTHCKEIPQGESVRVIRTLGNALEKMSRGGDQRIELELALFTLTEQPAATAPAAQASPVPSAPTPFASAPVPSASAPVPFASTPVQNQPVVASSAPQAATASSTPVPAATAQTPPMIVSSPAQAEEAPITIVLPKEELPLDPNTSAVPTQEPQSPATQPLEPVAVIVVPEEDSNETLLSVVAKRNAQSDGNITMQANVPSQPITQQPMTQSVPFDAWPQVLALIAKKHPPLYAYAEKSNAFILNRRILIDGDRIFRDFLRVNKDSQKQIKEIIFEVTGEHYSIGPYDAAKNKSQTASVEDAILDLEKKGVLITEKA